MAINQINENEIEVSAEAVENAGISPKLINDAIDQLLPMALLEACDQNKPLLIKAISKAGKKFIEFQCDMGSWSDTKHDKKRLKLITAIASSQILGSLSDKIDELENDDNQSVESDENKSLDDLVDKLLEAAEKKWAVNNEFI